MRISETAPVWPKLQSAIETMRRDGWATIELSGTQRERYAELAAHARSFFAMPPAAKQELDIRTSDGHRGWVSRDEAGDYADEGERRYEAFDIGRQPLRSDRHNHRLRGRNQWPSGRSGAELQHAAETMFTELSALADCVADAICANLGVSPDTLRSLRREPISQLRLIQYFEPTPGAVPSEPVIDLRDGHLDVFGAAPSTAAMGAHTDYEFFTFLYQESPGTQVLDDRGQWIDVPHDGVLTLLAGDMLAAFSDGAFESVMHRASPQVPGGRVAIPFFAGADFEAVVRPVIGTGCRSVHFGNHLMQQLRRDFPYLRDESIGINDLRRPGDLRSDFERRALRRAESSSTPN